MRATARPRRVSTPRSGTSRRLSGSPPSWISQRTTKPPKRLTPSGWLLPAEEPLLDDGRLEFQAYFAIARRIGRLRHDERLAILEQCGHRFLDRHGSGAVRLVLRTVFDTQHDPDFSFAKNFRPPVHVQCGIAA